MSSESSPSVPPLAGRDSRAGGRPPRAVVVAAVGLWVRAALRLPLLVAAVTGLTANPPGLYASALFWAWLAFHEPDLWAVGGAAAATGLDLADSGLSFWWIIVGEYSVVTALQVLLGCLVFSGVRGARVTANVVMMLSAVGCALAFLGLVMVTGVITTADLLSFLPLSGWTVVILAVTITVLASVNRKRAREYFDAKYRRATAAAAR